MNTIKRISVAGLIALGSLGVSAVALAETSDAKPLCDGKKGGEGKGAHFKKADKNSDGYLTREEIREKMALYFDAGAKEVWLCTNNGQMQFFTSTDNPRQSQLCPNFPAFLTA